MKVQAVKLDGINRIWLVINHDGKPVKPISQFIRYLYNIDKSPHTLRAYANHLKLYWDYLTASGGQLVPG